MKITSIIEQKKFEGRDPIWELRVNVGDIKIGIASSRKEDCEYAEVTTTWLLNKMNDLGVPLEKYEECTIKSTAMKYGIDHRDMPKRLINN